MKRHTTREALKQYVASFNSTDEETIVQAIPNAQAEEWLMKHIPRVLLPEPMLEQTYYFRWWLFRKHIKHTPDGTVITEFHPDVPWAGKHNTIVASGCHHIDEGRWLHDTSILDEYITFFYRGGASLRSYSNWLEHAVLGLCEVRGETALGVKLLPDMVKNHAGWDEANLHSSGLYWSNDDRDASEFSISGNGLRPTLNCYQYANEKAIAAFARSKGELETADCFDRRAQMLGDKINDVLWREEDRFYKVLPLENRNDRMPMGPVDPRRNAREIWGYLPWLFGAAPEGRADAFRQLLDMNGFRTAWGMTTAERRHPGFGLFYTGEELNAWRLSRDEKPVGPKGHECLWNGPSWPFSTCMALKALSNLLVSGEKQEAVNASDYLHLLAQYAGAHVRKLENGAFIPWLDENMNPDTGDWIARTRLMTWEDGHWSKDKGGYERGKDYNHSTYCDLVIGGLFGVRPTLDRVRIAPLFPAQWPYAVMEDLKVHGHDIIIQYENPCLGGAGYHIYVDRGCVFHTQTPQPFEMEL